MTNIEQMIVQLGTVRKVKESLPYGECSWSHIFVVLYVNTHSDFYCVDGKRLFLHFKWAMLLPWQGVCLYTSASCGHVIRMVQRIESSTVTLTCDGGIVSFR
jgi:hypothetical protein